MLGQDIDQLIPPTVPAAVYTGIGYHLPDCPGTRDSILFGYKYNMQP
jgi:hypothetical protein